MKLTILLFLVGNVTGAGIALAGAPPSPGMQKALKEKKAKKQLVESTRKAREPVLNAIRQGLEKNDLSALELPPEASIAKVMECRPGVATAAFARTRDLMLKLYRRKLDRATRVNQTVTFKDYRDESPHVLKASKRLSGPFRGCVVRSEFTTIRSGIIFRRANPNSSSSFTVVVDLVKLDDNWYLFDVNVT